MSPDRQHRGDRHGGSSAAPAAVPTRHRRSRAARRAFVAGGALALVGAVAAIPLYASASVHGEKFVVAADGSGQDRTVQAAIDAAPADGVSRTIVIKKGTYHEVVNVPAGKTHLRIRGATGNPDDVVITFGNASGTPKPGSGTYGTAGSATATFSANDLSVEGVTISNSFDAAASPSIKEAQAVAVNAQADRQVFQNDRFLGHQDTVLAWSPEATAQNRQYFFDDFISGAVDFMFGNATAVFDHDNIQAVDNGAAAGGVNGFLTAANTDSAKKYGFLITNSTVSSNGQANTFYLGRPWHPTGTSVAQVVVRDTVLPAAIHADQPWTDMSGFPWTSARFFEYHNSGPGAVADKNAPQLSDAQASDYTAQKYLAGTDGWNPVGGIKAGGGSGGGNGTGGSTGGGSTAGLASGDSRTVTQPTLPTVCATVPSTLAMPDRIAATAQETAPPDTSRIQHALDGCVQTGTGSVAVKLTSSGADTAFLTGPLTIGHGVVLLLDSDTTLYGSRNPADFQISGQSQCGTVAAAGRGCRPLISVAGADAGIEALRSPSGSQGRIDGRGDLTMLGGSTTWWGLAHQAQVSGGNQNNPRLIQAVNSDNFTLYDVDLLNSPNFHVVYQGGNGFTAWGVRIKTPADARNTDGIDPAGSTNVTINDSYIQTGDDGVAIKGGSAASNMTIENSHFYGTHGISIGSETNGGVSNILFRDNTLTGTDSSGIVSASSAGIRIKSSAANGGKVSDVTYLNTCLDAVRAPLVFDTHYSGGSGSSIPQFTGIVVDGVKSADSPSGANSVFQGYSAVLPLGLTLKNVQLDAAKNTAQYAHISTANTNLALSGTGVTVTPTATDSAALSCSFPAYPAL
ncbi:pectinesterase family protein [Kitasatospora mediocidica]|uniref:pectinesterase family protein n=1 Tax=Kitasatospora mediocidica TaxID=58352 RepID=UPI00068D464A|nr:pectinesterase family protein [Kitasatospora mediocidica]